MLYHTSTGVVEYDPKKCSEVGRISAPNKAPFKTKKCCAYCIYCEYRTSKYHCIHGFKDEIIFGKDPVCENFIKAELQARFDKNRNRPRLMGKQWGGEEE